MDEGVCASDHELLHSLQSGIPLHARPFQLIGEQLGLNEEHVLERLNFFLKSGMARRFGAVFNSYSLGYSSTLCAVSVPPEDIDRVADVLSPHPGVTHCYERDGDPNLWFTMTANKEGIADELRLLGEKLDPYVIMDLPATRRFKIRAVFDTRRNRGNDNTMKSEHSIKPQCIAPLTEQEKAVVRGLQGSIPIAADLFDQPARVSEMDVESLIALLEKWQKEDSVFFNSINAMEYYHRLQIQNFLQAVLQDRQPLITGRDGRKTVEIFTAIYRSQRDRSSIKFPLKPEWNRNDFDGRSV